MIEKLCSILSNDFPDWTPRDEDVDILMFSSAAKMTLLLMQLTSATVTGKMLATMAAGLALVLEAKHRGEDYSATPEDLGRFEDAVSAEHANAVSSLFLTAAASGHPKAMEVALSALAATYYRIASADDNSDDDGDNDLPQKSKVS